MNILVYSVYDAGVKAFGQPLFFRAEGEAIRSWLDACADEKSNMFRHAGDYSFFRLGSYDDAFGQFANAPTPELVMSALQAKPDSPR
jgi:hypothetical protein